MKKKYRQRGMWDNPEPAPGAIVFGILVAVLGLIIAFIHALPVIH